MNNPSDDAPNAAVPHSPTASVPQTPQMPWTGTGNSGSGVAGSPHGLRGLVQLRALLEDKGRGNDLWWFPHTPLLTKLAFALARSRGGNSMGSRIAARIAVLICLVRRMWER